MTVSLDTPVTVLIPIKNGQDTVRRTLLSLLSGMTSTDELVAIDDGSEDNSLRVLKAVAASDQRIRIIATKGVGFSQALNLGLRESLHSWVARADVDDLYPRERLACQRRAITEGTVLISGDYRISIGASPRGEMPSALTHPFVVGSLINPQRLPHPGVLYNRSAVLEAGGYDPEDFPADDLALWLRLQEYGDFVGVPDLVLNWNMTPGSVSHANQAQQRARTRFLLQSQFPRPLLSAIGEDDVERELARYVATRQEHRRRILLARDLRALTRIGLNRGSYTRALRSLASSPWKTLADTIRLAGEKGARTRSRARLNPSVS